MEQLNFVDPPNRPMNTNFKRTEGPKLHKDFIFIDVDDDARLLVGSTNATATFWEGSIQIFNSHKDYESGKWATYHNSPIVHDGKLLGKTGFILLAEAPGYLKLLKMPEEDTQLPVVKDCAAGIEKLSMISVWCNESTCITAGEQYITVWDINQTAGLRKVQQFSDYHTDELKSICVKGDDRNVFASVGIDRRLCVWDMRMEDVASEFYLNDFCSLTSVAYSGNSIAVGTEGGSVYLFDSAQPKDYLGVSHCYKAGVHKLVFSATGNLAVCANSCKIQVYNCNKNELDLIYEDQSHSKFVRGLAWCQDELFSCGFDSSVFKHTM